MDSTNRYVHLWLYRHPSGVCGVPWLTLFAKYPFVRLNLGKRAFDAVRALKSIGA